MSKTVSGILAEVRQQFREAKLDTPDLDARLLVQGIMGFNAEDIILKQGQLLTVFEAKKIAEAVKRRVAHEPVSRILGTRSFWRSDFKLSPDTLDPRPDSETLIEAVLKSVDRAAPLTLIDLGTGTGCLLLSLLQELPYATGVGIDISPGAVETAAQNAEVLGLAHRSLFITSDWKSFKYERQFDIVISNPPYISDAEMHELAPEVSEYDPHRALFGGVDGLDCYRQIVRMLPSILKNQGKIFFEIGATQAESVKEILAAEGYLMVQTAVDIAGHDRCIIAQ